MSSQFHAVQTDEVKHWRDILQGCVSYDVYHLPGYHQLAEEQNDGHATLLVYEDEPVVIAIPLLLRRLDSVEGIEVAADHFDATSVYGYPGPITNAAHITESVAKDFSHSLHSYLENRNVVAAFSRLHPLIEQVTLMSGFGEVLDIGPTVCIDLTLSEQEQRDQYRNNHRRDIESAQEGGVACAYDEQWIYLDDFIDTYYENMRRVAADDYYFFDRSYFTRLRDLLRDHLELFVVLKGKVVIAGALFTVCDSIVQYHLGGTRTDYLHWSPIKLIFDEVRQWGTRNGARILHLGGGVGGKKDGLFRFKAGFSNQTRQFKIWRAIVDHEIYRALTEQKQAWNEERGLEAADQDYFPAYRAPTRERIEGVL